MKVSPLARIDRRPRLPVLWLSRGRHPEPHWLDDRAAGALLAALELVARRGEGPNAWGKPLDEDPIAFLLDAMSDAVQVWAHGVLVYCNPAARRLEPGAPRVHRRLHFHRTGDDLVLEIISPALAKAARPHQSPDTKPAP
jgi:hypothetical protein